MLDKIVKTITETERRPIAAEIAAVAVAFAAILLISLVFKVWWMPRGEKYVRGCMQDTALAAAKFPDARKLSKKGPNMHPRLYAALPLLSPKNKPGNKLMLKVHGFCEELYKKEADANNLHRMIIDNKMNYLAYPRELAVKVRERINNGWVVEGNVKAQRELLDRTIDTWKVNGHNFDVQDLLKRYEDDVSSNGQKALYNRLFKGGGRFMIKDVCRNRALFEKHKIVKSPTAFYNKINCD